MCESNAIKQILESWVGAQVVQDWIHFQTDQLKAATVICPVEPLEGPIGFTKGGIDSRYRIGRCLRLTWIGYFINQLDGLASISRQGVGVSHQGLDTGLDRGAATDQSDDFPKLRDWVKRQVGWQVVAAHTANLES